MSEVFLTDSEIKDNLFPLTLTRSAADIRVGILTIREKWEAYLGRPIKLKEESLTTPEDAMIVSANIIPSKEFIDSLFNEPAGTSENPDWNEVKIVQFPWHIFQWNEWALRKDFELLTTGRRSAPTPSHVAAINPKEIFIEDGARLSHCIINADAGPVYIGKDTTIMEGAVIRGPFALCQGSVVKMGSRIYGATTVGPQCIVGGEIKNSVFFGYSNKAHDGYLGDSVIGEWCNLGAGTSSSNVKNTAGNVKVYNAVSQKPVDSGLQKCGVIIGDYSRAAINTAFNTGSVVGVCANVFGEGLTPAFIPSFSWGYRPFGRYTFQKAVMDIGNWKRMKNARVMAYEETRLKLIFDENQID